MIKHGIKFYLKDKSKSETFLILSLSAGGFRLKFNLTGFRLSPKDFDLTKQRCKGSAGHLNHKLIELTSKIDSYFYSTQTVSIDGLRLAVGGFINSSISKQAGGGFEFLEQFLSSKNSSSAVMYKSVLKKYLPLSSQELKKSLGGLKHNTQKNILRYMTVYFNWVTNNELADYSLKIKELKLINNDLKKSVTSGHLIALNENDLELLYNFQGRKLQKIAVDLFLIQCYVGCRFSDLHKITKNSITLFDSVENDLYGYIELSSTKTRTYTKIPIHKKLYEILKRNDFKVKKYNYLHNYNNVLRGALKNIFIDLIDIDDGSRITQVPKYQLISSHVARRTFITLMVKKGVALKAIMDVAGITDVKTIMRYQKLVKSESADMVASAFNSF